MSVKIRLARRGRKKMAMFDVVVADARAPRDGRFIEKIGTYNPNVNPAFINIDEQKALNWIMQGAQPTTTARAILSEKGVMFKKHLQVGINKGAITQEHADKKFDEWFKNKEKQNQEILSKLTEANARMARTKLEAEKKVNETRAAAIMKRKQDAEAALVAEITKEETSTEKEIVEEADETVSKQKGPEKAKGSKDEAKEETKVVETKVEETKAEETKEEETKAEETKAEETKAEETKVDKTQENDKGAEAPGKIPK